MLLAGFLNFFPPVALAGTAAAGGPVTEELGFIEIGDVFAAAKHLQSLQEAPAAITIVTDEDIRRYGHRTLTDAVNSVRGFYTYSDRNYEYIGLRGFARLGDYGNRVLQLVDGHTNNDNVYGSFFLGQDFGIDMDLVRKIEFIRGPGSALYGSNALLGTVNVITKSGEELGGLVTSVDAGSGGARNGRLAYGHRYGNGLDLLVAAGFAGSTGEDLNYPEFRDTAPGGGWARDADGERARKFLFKAAWGEFSLLANLGWREKNVPTGSYGTLFNDNRNRTVDERAFAEIAWDHPFEGESRIKSRAYFDSYRFDGYYPYDYPPVTMNRDEVSGKWVGGEVVYDRKLAAHHLLAGGELAHHLEARQLNYDESPRTVYMDENHTFTNGSLFGQDEWDILPWLRFSGGLRYDRYSTFGDHVSPRAAFILRPGGGSTVKILYGRAFRAPNVYEFYYRTSTGSSVYRDNPDLKPETVHTYELVLEQDLTAVVRGSVSIYRYEIKDLITQQILDDGSLQFRNISRVQSDGLEIGLDLNWPGLLKGDVGYAYQDTRDDLTGRWLANSPRHLLKAGFRLPLYREMIFAGARCRYLGRRADRDGSDVGGTLVTDIHLSADYRDWILSAGAYNVFDVVAADPVSVDHLQRTVQLDGRRFWVKLGYTF